MRLWLVVVKAHLGDIALAIVVLLLLESDGTTLSELLTCNTTAFVMQFFGVCRGRSVVGVLFTMRVLCGRKVLRCASPGLELPDAPVCATGNAYHFFFLGRITA